jgi:hypothetical protein
LKSIFFSPPLQASLKKNCGHPSTKTPQFQALANKGNHHNLLNILVIISVQLFGMSQLTHICHIDMLLCMRTTLNIKDDLMRAAKRQAVERGTTITKVIEQALRDSLAKGANARAGYTFRWQTVRGTPLPGVDLTDRDSLMDRMDGRN